LVRHISHIFDTAIPELSYSVYDDIYRQFLNVPEPLCILRHTHLDLEIKGDSTTLGPAFIASSMSILNYALYPSAGTTVCIDEKRTKPTPPKRRSSVSSHKTTTPGGIAGRLVRAIRQSEKTLKSGALQLHDGLTDDQRYATKRQSERVRELRQQLKDAKTIDEWRAAANDLDLAEGKDIWKRNNETNDFDAPLLEARLKLFDDARAAGDVRRMLYLVRTTLTRNLGNMGNVELYKHTHTGTKTLVEEYVNSAIATIHELVNTPERALPAGIDSRELLEQVVCARQSFGRSAILLSGGATLGMYHIGVLSALFEADLLPRIISGSSAGSIVSSVLCVTVDDDLPKVIEEFPYGDLAVFEAEDHPESPLEHIYRLLTDGSWIDVKHLTRVMRDILGDVTFQEAYNRTRRILNICVSPSSMYEQQRLLNYITSPNVLIWSAVAASCSIPMIFSTCELMSKDPITGEHVPWNPTPSRWIDGSVDMDLPMTRLAEMFNVNHFIVSQVNPHVVPFLPPSSAPSLSHSSGQFIFNSALNRYIGTAISIAKAEAMHRLEVLTQMNILPNVCTKVKNLMAQNYSGHITIVPQVQWEDLTRLLANPTPEFMLKAMQAGEKATWPLESRVKMGCAIELELDKAVAALRARVVFGSEGGADKVLGSPASERRRNSRRKRTQSGEYFLGLARHQSTRGVQDHPATQHTAHRVGSSLHLHQRAQAKESRIRPAIRSSRSYGAPSGLYSFAGQPGLPFFSNTDPPGDDEMESMIRLRQRQRKDEVTVGVLSSGTASTNVTDGESHGEEGETAWTDESAAEAGDEAGHDGEHTGLEMSSRTKADKKTKGR
jgi:TAG lipase/steryl ester hydrolase/phospholipase A2/LPA acyltransferase